MCIEPALRDPLAGIVGPQNLITEPAALLAYESDALTLHRGRPGAVVIPKDTEEVAAVVRTLYEIGHPFVARGAGTGLSGGAVALDGAIIISLARLDQILELDPVSRRATVEAGVINEELSRAAEPYGLYFAPDPSSQSACTIGGNVAENAGGPHCLKYGVTADHILGAVVVLPDGRITGLGSLGGGGGGLEGGYDLVGLMTGSEGTLGIVTEIEVRLLPRAEGVETILALFDRVEDASGVVSSIIGAGLLPAALELIDRETILLVEESIFAAGLPTDIGAALVIEFDGPLAGLSDDAQRAAELCELGGAREVTRARDAAERERLWQARKKAFGAMGRAAPDLVVQDAVVPRTRLAEVVRATYEIAERYELRITNVFHAGDGNLHPTIFFDRRDADQRRRVERASREIMERCIAAGGTITGEHGVGLDKLDYMRLVHDDVALGLMTEIRDLFDPHGLSNPGKLLPPLEGVTPTRGVEDEDGGGTHGVLYYDPADLTISVRADLTLDELQRVLAREGQWLPLDPPGDAGLRLDEIFLNGLAGPLREGYGGPQNLALGCEFITGDGRRVRAGGRLMKDVAGYDLTRLIIGSRGELGELMSLDLRLRARPEADQTVVVTTRQGEELVELAEAIRAERVSTVALELLSPLATTAVVGTERGEWGLLTRIHGNRRGADGLRDALIALIDQGGLEYQVYEESENGGGLWRSLAEFEGRAEVVIRITGPPRALGRLLEVGEGIEGDDGEPLPLIAHAGAGIVRLPLIGAGLSYTRLERGLERLELEGVRVFITGREGLPTTLTQAVGPTDPGAAELEEGIRGILDPEGRLDRAYEVMRLR